MASPDPTGRPLAHPWRRLAAAVIDALILLVPCAALVYVHPLAALVAAIAYGTVLELRGERQSPGKRLCAIAAERSDGRPLDARAAFVRNVLKYGSLAFSASAWGFLVPLAIFAPAFTPARLGLHDLAARTCVRHAKGEGLSDLVVGAIGLFGPIVFVVALLPLLLNPVANARARESVQAAMRDAAPRKASVEAYIAQRGELPSNAAIVLQPEGMAGHIVLTPVMHEGHVQWECHGEEIARGQLPRECRDEN
jgi:uncharacterized RDD family membrane protein YckC